MSFIGIVEKDLDEAAVAALAAAKVAVAYIDNVVVKDIEPALLSALLSAIEKLGSEAVTALLSSVGITAALPTSPAPTETPVAT